MTHHPTHQQQATFYRDVLHAAHEWFQRGCPDRAARVVQLGLDGRRPCEECPHREQQKSLFDSEE